MTWRTWTNSAARSQLCGREHEPDTLSFARTSHPFAGGESPRVEVSVDAFAVTWTDRFQHLDWDIPLLRLTVLGPRWLILPASCATLLCQLTSL